MIVYTEEEYAALPVGTEMKSPLFSLTVTKYEDGWGWTRDGESWHAIPQKKSGLTIGGSGWAVLESVPLWEMA
jgi:hypothetical protein